MKKIIFGISICFCLASNIVPAIASEPQTIVIPTSNGSIQRYDVYTYKYKIINGIRYRRLWNSTKGEWAEPYWTPCP